VAGWYWRKYDVFFFRKRIGKWIFAKINGAIELYGSALNDPFAEGGSHEGAFDEEHVQNKCVGLYPFFVNAVFDVGGRISGRKII
jgi:hypothetical protein